MAMRIFTTDGVKFSNENGQLRVEQGRDVGHDERVEYSVLIPLDGNASILELQERAMRRAAERLLKTADAIKVSIEEDRKRLAQKAA